MQQASFANARASAKEEGIARFDVIQQIDDPTKFVLVEVSMFCFFLSISQRIFSNE